MFRFCRVKTLQIMRCKCPYDTTKLGRKKSKCFKTISGKTVFHQGPQHYFTHSCVMTTKIPQRICRTLLGKRVEEQALAMAKAHRGLLVLAVTQLASWLLPSSLNRSFQKHCKKKKKKKGPRQILLLLVLCQHLILISSVFDFNTDLKLHFQVLQCTIISLLHRDKMRHRKGKSC